MYISSGNILLLLLFTQQNSLLLPNFRSPEDVQWTQSPQSPDNSVFKSLLFTPKDPIFCICNIQDTAATLSILRYGVVPSVFHYHVHYHPIDVSKLEHTAALSSHKRVDSYCPRSRVHVNTAPET
jgi:hypothetical protein